MLAIVTDENGTALAQQALVKLYNETTRAQIWQPTDKKSDVAFASVPPGHYELQTSTAGYDTATQSLNLASGQQLRIVYIRLKRKRNIKAGQSLSRDAMKHLEKGLAALNSGHLHRGQKQLQSALRLAPTNADVNFLLGFLFERRQDPARAESYFAKAVSLDPQQLHAWTLLGQLRESSGDYAGAIPPLRKAVSIDEHHWLAHWALALAYFHLQHFHKASAEAEAALRTGHGNANGALVIRGLSLAQVGKRNQALAAFKAFLRDQPEDPAAPAVHRALARLEALSFISGEGNLPLRALGSYASMAIGPLQSR